MISYFFVVVITTVLSRLIGPLFPEFHKRVKERIIKERNEKEKSNLKFENRNKNVNED